jgi:quinone-modifying oxidoreductase subunit QmoC
MVWAQWGFKDRLLRDPDVWLCHQCNECSTYCPRDAKPGDLMAAVRAYQIESFSAPKILGKATSRLQFLPLAFIPPVLLTFIMVLFAVIIPEGGLVYPEGDILFENFLGTMYIDIFSAIAVGFAALVAWIGGRRFWKAISESETGPSQVREGFVKSLMLTLVDIASHRYFKLCKVNKARGHAHMSILYGFLFLFTASGLAFIYTVILNRELSLPIWDPAKIIGNLGGFLLLLGLSVVSLRRLFRRDAAGGSMYFDWYFIGLLYVLTLTGFALEIVRYAELREVAYSLYMGHLVFYFMLFTYLPFTKFAHVIYRTLALTHTRQRDRLPASHRPAQEVVQAPG